jgi:hypothetical protein
VLFAVTAAVSLVVLFAPGSDVPTAPAGTDKVVHVLLFAALAGTGARAGIGRRYLVVGLLAYAVGSELAQSALAALGRSGSAWDAMADGAGTLLGLAIGNRRVR